MDVPLLIAGTPEALRVRFQFTQLHEQMMLDAREKAGLIILFGRTYPGAQAGAGLEGYRETRSARAPSRDGDHNRSQSLPARALDNKSGNLQQVLILLGVCCLATITAKMAGKDILRLGKWIRGKIGSPTTSDVEAAQDPSITAGPTIATTSGS